MKKLAIAFGTTFASLGATVGGALACASGSHEVLQCILFVPGGCVKWILLCVPNQ
jgi:hypothetical protein